MQFCIARLTSIPNANYILTRTSSEHEITFETNRNRVGAVSILKDSWGLWASRIRREGLPHGGTLKVEGVIALLQILALQSSSITISDERAAGTKDAGSPPPPSIRIDKTFFERRD
jgi:hypothetical protein